MSDSTPETKIHTFTTNEMDDMYAGIQAAMLNDCITSDELGNRYAGIIMHEHRRDLDVHSRKTRTTDDRHHRWHYADPVSVEPTQGWDSSARKFPTSPFPE